MKTVTNYTCLRQRWYRRLWLWIKRYVFRIKDPWVGSSMTMNGQTATITDYNPLKNTMTVDKPFDAPTNSDRYELGKRATP